MLRTFITDSIRIETDFVQFLNVMRLLEMVEGEESVRFLLQCSCEELRSDVEHLYHRFDWSEDRGRLDSEWNDIFEDDRR